MFDSVIALIIAFTKLGDDTIEANYFMRRYLPLTRGWAVVYALLSTYIAYLTFMVI